MHKLGDGVSWMDDGMSLYLDRSMDASCICLFVCSCITGKA